MGAISHTVDGDSNLVSFKSAARVPITSLKAHFKPKQDLHGYSKPWPAGGGKNLFNENTPIETGQYYDNGYYETLTSRIITDYIPIEYGNTYTISINSSIDNLALVNYNLFNENKNWLGSRSANGEDTFAGETIHTFTVNIQDSKYVRIVFRDKDDPSLVISSKDLSNSKIQVELGSAATSYEPYENICPIEGWNNVVGTHSGKNLLDEKFLSNLSNYPIDGAYSYKYTNPIFLVPNTTYTISFTDAVRYETTRYWAIKIYNNEYDTYDKSGTIEYLINQTYRVNKTFTTGISGVIRFAVFGGQSTLDDIWNNVNVQLELGSTITSYEPHQGSIIPVTFPITGKNKFDYSNANIANIKRRDDNGNEIADASGSYCQLLIPVIPNTTYTLSGYTNNNVSKRIYFIQEDETFISRTAAFGNDSYTFTTPNNCYYIQIQNREIENAGWETVQLELGDTATTYEPYNPNNTVYGGYVDVAAGELVAEYKIIDLSTLTWTPYARTAGGETDRIRSEVISDVLRPATTSETPSFVAEQLYPIPTGYNFTNYPNGLSVQLSSGYFYKYFDGEHYPQGKLTYKLSQSLHYPIAFAKHTTFLNQNNIWSNTNDITEVSYAIYDSAPIRAAKKRMAAENAKHYRKVIWNNKINGYLSADDWQDRDSTHTTTTFSNGEATVTFLLTNAQISYHTMVSKNTPTVYLSHKYYAAAQYNCNKACSIGFEYAGGKQISDYGNITNDWIKRSYIVQGNRDGGGAMYAPFMGASTISNSGELVVKVKNVFYIDLTLMFGEGNEPTKAEFEKLCVLNNIDFNSAYPKNTNGTEQIWVFP
jgi:hypothetical protein